MRSHRRGDDDPERGAGPAPRRRIWEVECPLLDAVLALTFEARELENALGAAGVPAPACGCPAGRSAVTLAHRASHGDGPFARRLERVLDLVHRRELLRLPELGLAAFAAETSSREPREVPGLAGRLWALATCSDPGADEARARACRALEVDALRALRVALEPAAALEPWTEG